MKTNKFLGRDWISPELDYTKEEWETLIDLSLQLKREFALNKDQTGILKNQTLFSMFFNQTPIIFAHFLV